MADTYVFLLTFAAIHLLLHNGGTTKPTYQIFIAYFTPF